MLRWWTDLDLAYYTEPTNPPKPPQINNYYCINDKFNLFERVQFWTHGIVNYYFCDLILVDIHYLSEDEIKKFNTITLQCDPKLLKNKPKPFRVYSISMVV